MDLFLSHCCSVDTLLQLFSWQRHPTYHTGLGNQKRLSLLQSNILYIELNKTYKQFNERASGLWPGLWTAHSRSPSSVTTVIWAADRFSSSSVGSTISVDLQREQTSNPNRIDPGGRKNCTWFTYSSKMQKDEPTGCLWIFSPCLFSKSTTGKWVSALIIASGSWATRRVVENVIMAQQFHKTAVELNHKSKFNQLQLLISQHILIFRAASRAITQASRRFPS